MELFLGRLEVIWGRLEAVLEYLEAILEVFLEQSWSILGASRATLRLYWASRGPLGSAPRAILEHLGGLLDRLEAILGVSERSFGGSGPSWSVLGASWGSLVLLWGLFASGKVAREHAGAHGNAWEILGAPGHTQNCSLSAPEKVFITRYRGL